MLRGADFSRFRPKIIVVEAIKPLSLAPAWDEWEPLLAQARLRLCLGRRAQPLLRRRGGARARRHADRGPEMVCGRPADREFQAGSRGPDPSGSPPRAAARRRRHGEAAADRPQAELLDLLTAGVAPDLDRPATAADIAAIIERACSAPLPHAQQSSAAGGETIRDVYRADHRFRCIPRRLRPHRGELRVVNGAFFVLRPDDLPPCMHSLYGVNRAAGCGTSRIHQPS